MAAIGAIHPGARFAAPAVPRHFRVGLCAVAAPLGATAALGDRSRGEGAGEGEQGGPAVVGEAAHGLGSPTVWGP